MPPTTQQEPATTEVRWLTAPPPQASADAISALMEDRYIVAVAVAYLADAWVRNATDRRIILDKFGLRTAQALTQATGVA